MGAKRESRCGRIQRRAPAPVNIKSVYKPSVHDMHSGGGGPALKVATMVAASTPPPKHLDIFKEAPLRLPKPLSDQFPVRVCSCPLCIINRL